MMDAKLAASSPSPDLNIQIKQGGKAEKATSGGERGAFRSALDERLASRGNAAPRLDLRPTGDQEEDTPQGTAAQPDRAARTVARIPGITKPLGLASSIARTATPTLPLRPGDHPAVDAKSAKDPKTRTEQASGKVRETTAHHRSRGEAEVAGVSDGDDVEETGPLDTFEKAHAVLFGGEKAAEDPALAPDADRTAKDALVLLKEAGPDRAEGQMQAAAATVTATTDSADASAQGAEADGRSAIYRIARADGRGQMFEIEGPIVPEAGEKNVQSKADFGGTVLVVDQRRYLAPTATNPLSIASAIAGDPEWTRALQPEQTLANAALQAGNGRVVNTLKIQLHPIELGLVTATLKLTGDELSVELKVDNGLALRSLKDDQAKIIEALKAHGFAVDQVNVSIGADRPDSQASNQQNGQANFAQQQQQARDGGQNAPMSRERGRSYQERNGDGKAAADELRVETGSVGGTGGSRPGHVYL